MCEVQLENNRCIEKVIGRKYGNKRNKTIGRKVSKIYTKAYLEDNLSMLYIVTVNFTRVPSLSTSYSFLKVV